jgi:hypothetical protein
MALERVPCEGDYCVAYFQWRWKKIDRRWSVRLREWGAGRALAFGYYREGADGKYGKWTWWQFMAPIQKTSF